ncbi:MAG: tyrosine-type recombinase/integrase [bacterium]|nr:tyrosine-type recombinase/integrase [bacterium]
MTSAFTRDATCGGSILAIRRSRAANIVRPPGNQAQEYFDAVLTGIRRTAATRLVSRGADPATVMAILRHSSLKMVMRYVHPSEKAKREAVELLSNDGHKAVTFPQEATQEARCAFA